MRFKKKATLTLYLTFFLAAVIIVTFAAVLAPMGVLFNTEMYRAGEDILGKANASIANIQNAEVRGEVQSALNASFAAAQNNIEVNNSVFQYSWVAVVVLLGIIMFIGARRLTEIGTGGFT